MFLSSEPEYNRLSFEKHKLRTGIEWSTGIGYEQRYYGTNESLSFSPDPVHIQYHLYDHQLNTTHPVTTYESFSLSFTTANDMMNPAFVSIEYSDTNVYTVKCQHLQKVLDISESKDQALIAPLPLPVNSNFPYIFFGKHHLHPQKIQFARLPSDPATLSLLEHLAHHPNYRYKPVREFLKQIYPSTVFVARISSVLLAATLTTPIC